MGPPNRRNDVDRLGLDDRRPGVVTSISRGRRGKVLVSIEGQDHPLEVARETLAAYPLHEGEELQGEDLQRFLAEDLRLEARARALRFLETRERSSSEVRLRLRRYGYGEELIEATLGYLADRGFLDDRRFAEFYAREKLRSGWGPRRVQAELGRKGLARPLIAEALDALRNDSASPWAAAGKGQEATAATGGPDRQDELLALVERKFGRDLKQDRPRAERRVAGFLGRRGHDWERIDQVLRALRSRISE